MQQGSETHFKWSMLLNVSVFKAALQAIFTRGRKKKCIRRGLDKAEVQEDVI